MKTTKSLLKSVYVLGFLISTSLSTAQLQKGNWLFEGSLGNINTYKSDSESTFGSSTSSSENKSFSFNVYPRFGYFINDSFVLGVTPSFGFNSNSSEYKNTNGIKTSESETSSSYVDVAPFIRYYFSGKEKLRFYGQVGAGFSFELSRKTDGSNYNGTTGALTTTYSYSYPKNYASFSVEGLIGLNYFFSENVAFNSGIGYLHQKSTQTTESTSTPVGGSATTSESDYKNTYNRISWNFGFTIFLHGSKSTAE